MRVEGGFPFTHKNQLKQKTSSNHQSKPPANANLTFAVWQSMKNKMLVTIWVCLLSRVLLLRGSKGEPFKRTTATLGGPTLKIRAIWVCLTAAKKGCVPCDPANSSTSPRTCRHIFALHQWRDGSAKCQSAQAWCDAPSPLSVASGSAVFKLATGFY